MPNFFPRSIYVWSHKTWSLLEERKKHLIVRLKNLCRMFSKEYVIRPSMYIQFSEVGVEVAFYHAWAVAYYKVDVLKRPHFIGKIVGFEFDGFKSLLKKECMFNSSDKSQFWQIAQSSLLDSSKLRGFLSHQCAHSTIPFKCDKLELSFWILCDMPADIQLDPDNVVGTCKFCYNPCAACTIDVCITLFCYTNIAYWRIVMVLWFP